jgi:hypothetical protein
MHHHVMASRTSFPYKNRHYEEPRFVHHQTAFDADLARVHHKSAVGGGCVCHILYRHRHAEFVSAVVPSESRDFDADDVGIERAGTRDAGQSSIRSHNNGFVGSDADIEPVFRDLQGLYHEGNIGECID